MDNIFSKIGSGIKSGVQSVASVVRGIPEALKKQRKFFRQFGPQTPEEAREVGLIPTKIGDETFYLDPLGFVTGIKKVGGKAVSEAVKTLTKSPALTKHFGFLKEISAPLELRPPSKVQLTGKAIEQGIALRATKAGKLVPSVRKSGVFVPEEFATYKNFKDVKPGAFGGTKDITRLIQEIDGALPTKELVKLPGQAGPTTKYVLWRTRDMMKQSIEFQQESLIRLKKIIGNIKPRSKEAQTANRVLEKIGSADKNLPIDTLIAKKSISEITTNPEIVRLARNARNFFDDMLDMQNVVRQERGQKLIPKRDFYSPNEFKNRSLWEKSFGLKQEPAKLIRTPELPDYIFPDKPFNPRELAREHGLKEFEKEMDLVTLMDNYTRTATKDIFSTSIIQNNKAFIQQLDSMGLPNSARSLQNWTAEAFAGVKASVDRTANLSPSIEKGMAWWRRRLARSVFPLNFAWNTFIQTGSATLTGTRYGWLNTAKSAQEWFTNPIIRDEIFENAYSQIIKSQKIGKISQQDINKGIVASKKLTQGKLDTATDAANFMTEWIEKNLTGMSVRAAYKDGAKRGLKGKALWEYASDGGAKTQSMYNMEDLPGILRSNLVKTGAPFQTFSFEMFNSMREFAGKTGVPPGTFQERMKMLLRFGAGMWATNTVSEAANGRRPWEASSFIPFYGNFITPIFSNKSSDTARALPSFISVGRDVAEGMEDVIKDGDFTKLRKTAIRYGLPFGGTQANRVVEGIIDNSKEGHESASGKLLFPIVESKEKMRAILFGPYGTKAGQEFIKKRNQ